ncbi:MAG: response regulator transcription factor [Bacteroidia bacterium]
MNQKITAVVADHRVLYRELLSDHLTKKGLSVIEHCATITSSFSQIPDIVLFSTTLQPDEAAADMRSILEKYPDLKILVLAAENTADCAVEWVMAGAKGYISHDHSTGNLVKTIRQIHERGFDYNMIPAQSFMEKFNERNRQKKIRAEFNKRQLELMPLLCKGIPYKQIADRLSISVKTVDYNRRAILKKTGCCSNEELVHYCMKQKLIEL